MKPRKNKNRVDEETKNRYSLPPYTKIPKSSASDYLTPKLGQDYIADIELSEERYKFNSTNNPNPHLALSIFVKCVEMGYYPPEEVMLFISDKFKKYSNSDKSLDSVIGLSKTTRKEFVKSKRDRNIALEINTLRHIFDIGIPYAVEAVTSKYANDDIYLSVASIQDIYDRYGRKQVNESLNYAQEDLKFLDEMSKEFKKKWIDEYLNQFGKDVKDYLLKNIR